jgi:hypothetical protein
MSALLRGWTRLPKIATTEDTKETFLAINVGPAIAGLITSVTLPSGALAD